VRNTNLALLLKATLFPAVVGVPDPIGDAVLFVALMYAGVAGPLTIPLIVLHRWRARREAPGAQASRQA
jgi:BASS family bile acid:Na+ symporter